MVFETELGSTGGRRFARTILEWLDTLVLSLFVVITAFTFFFSVVSVSGPSMENTLFDKDKLLITDFNYTPENGDIVIISRNYGNLAADNEDNNYKMPIVKRVIAVGGQTVEIKDGCVYVDNKLIEEDYTTSPTYNFEFTEKQTVPEGHIFVLGDNRKVSHDSRSNDIGMVDKRYVMGKVIARFYPINDFTTF